MAISSQKVGGIAALVEAATFIIGIALFVTVLSDYTTGDATPAESVAFLVDNKAFLYIWNIIIFIIFGLALVPVVLALHERLPLRDTNAGAGIDGVRSHLGGARVGGGDGHQHRYRVDRRSQRNGPGPR